MKDQNRGLALNLDLYQLTMAAAYVESGLKIRPTFELFVRQIPERRSYLLVAGLEQALEFLAGLRFHESEIDYLRGLPQFKAVKEDFFEYLESFRFRGEVWAMPEGSVAFAQEPLLRVTAEIIEAQIVETYLLSIINFQTLIATKASRVVAAAQGRPVADFGTRRAHGPEAGVLAARASWIGGCAGTSNVEAGFRYGIPVMGTAAHSFIMAYESELEAFRNYVKTFPEGTSLLIDTYDTLDGARKAASFGPRLGSVRLDSGDIAALSKKVRGILDRAGCDKVKIIASGDLNENRIAELLKRGAQVDLFGVGTEMAVSKDAPALGGVYKLVATGRRGARSYALKLSPQKETYPGAKQVLRKLDSSGSYKSDTIALAGERPGKSEIPVLQLVMKDGAALKAPVPLQDIRSRAAENLGRLPDKYKRLEGAERYPVRASDALRKLHSKVAETRRKQESEPRVAGRRGRR
jgi:nicotinate phosphoribosyltransferase